MTINNDSSSVPSVNDKIQQHHDEEQQQQQSSDFNNNNNNDTRNLLSDDVMSKFGSKRDKNSSSSSSTTTNDVVYKQLLCGGLAGATAKTVTAPLSRLTILYQVHSMVTTKKHHPQFALSLDGGFRKVVDRGGIRSLWRGNLTSVLHRFPYSAINFYVYEHMLQVLSQRHQQQQQQRNRMDEDGTTVNTTESSVLDIDDDVTETTQQLARRLTTVMSHRSVGHEVDNNDNDDDATATTTTTTTSAAGTKFVAGATAGCVAVVACYPLDLLRTRLTTELEGREHYRGLVDASYKIYRSEGYVRGFYSGLVPTLAVAVPNFAISYTVYGTLKEQALDDELFYNLRQIDADSGEPKLGYVLTLACGASSGTLATLVTFPMDTIRRRMQIQNLHLPETERLSATKHIHNMITKEGIVSLYRGLTPELLKVIPMVSTLFFVYESSKEFLGV